MSIFSSKKQTNNKEKEKEKKVEKTVNEEKKDKKEKGKKEVKKETSIKQQSNQKNRIVFNNKNYLFIKHPHVTEKSQSLKEYRQYVFQTINDANKSEVKKAIEQIYNVKVEKVRMLEMPAKKRRAGATFGKKSGYKKAVVTLKEGYQIEVIPQK